MKTRSLILMACLGLGFLAGHAGVITVPGDEYTVQAAIDRACPNDTILVYPGTFTGTINFQGKDVTLASLFLLTGDSTYIDRTILDGGENGKVVIMTSGESRSAVLCGLTIRNGTGGIYLYNSHPTIDHVVIKNNAAVRGGGICCYFADPLLTHVTLLENEATREGGAIYGKESGIVMQNCRFLDNDAGEKGGALYFRDSEPELVNAEVMSNDAPYGAGMYLHSSDAAGNGVSFTFNIADYYGGGLFLNNSSIDMDDLTVSHNTAWDYSGGGIYSISSEVNADVFVISMNNSINGGGLCLSQSEADLRNGSINNNYAVSGGGIHCELSSPLLTDVTIENNYATKGGGISCIDSSPVFQNPVITGNAAQNQGGGISCEYSSMQMTNGIISENTSEQGGGVWFQGSGSVFQNTRIINNDAGDGAGIYCRNSTPALTDVEISENISQNRGGGIYCYSSSPQFQRITISHNKARCGGGIYCVENETPVFCNSNLCNVYLNDAVDANDIYSTCPFTVIVDTFSVMQPTDHYTSPVENFTFSIRHKKINQVNSDVFVSPDGDDNNNGLTPGTAVRTIHHAKGLILSNSSDPNTIYLMEGTYSAASNGDFFPIHTIDYTTVRGFYGNEVILDAKGQSEVIVIDNDLGVEVLNLTIKGGSGAGIRIENSSVSASDLEVIDNAGTGLYCRESMLTLSGSLIANNTSDDGGGISSVNSTLHVDDVSVVKNWSDNRGGGFFCSGSAVAITGSDISMNSSPEGAGIASTGSHLVINTSRIKNNTTSGRGGGMMIEEGSLLLDNTEMEDNTAYHGGGIFALNTVLALDNLVLKGNIVENKGGGIYAGYSKVGIHSATLLYNHASYGGGMFLDSADPLIEQSLISGNVASDGGGMFCRLSDAVINNTEISYNFGYDEGGGIHCRASDTKLTNCLITDNYSSGHGGGLFYFRSEPELNNVSMAFNKALKNGGGIYLWNDCKAVINNSILWGDRPEEVHIASYPDTVDLAVSYSCVEGGETGVVRNKYGNVQWLEGNIDENPLFSYIGLYPFELFEGSPCIDGGDPDISQMFYLPEDIMGNPRIIDGDQNGSFIIDMGAYEFGDLAVAIVDPGSLTDADEQEISMTCYPNPVSGTSTISYQVDEERMVRITLNDLSGRVLRTFAEGQHTPGNYKVYWDAGELPQGMYVILLTVDNQIVTSKISVNR